MVLSFWVTMLCDGHVRAARARERERSLAPMSSRRVLAWEEKRDSSQYLHRSKAHHLCSFLLQQHKCLGPQRHKLKASLTCLIQTNNNKVHVLPQEMLGGSTFGLSMWLLKWLPVQTVDRLLLFVSRLVLGDTARLGLARPRTGPLELKQVSGKTPVLDVGTFARIRSGDVKVRPAIKRLTVHGAEFVDGRSDHFDAIILATGYKSNVPSWLKETEMFSEKDGLPRRPFPNGWKGDRGLYAVGFTKRGLLGASADARRIAHDIEQCWKMPQARRLTSFSSPTKFPN